jgi:hypothetical protein
MVFNLTHSQLILRYKENGGRIEPYTIVIMLFTGQFTGAISAQQFKIYVCCMTLANSRWSKFCLWLKHREGKKIQRDLGRPKKRPLLWQTDVKSTLEIVLKSISLSNLSTF